MPKISVIIPIYNNEKYLRQCLDSVVNQTLEDIEIICINDGSTDNSLQILNGYASKDKRFIVINQENTGVAKARNNSLDIAKGTFVAFMDSDDYYPSPNVLQTLFEKATMSNALICGGSICEDHNGKIKTAFNAPLNDYVFTKEQIVPFTDYQFDYGYHRFIYNLNMLKNNGIYFPLYSRFQDPPFFVRAMIAANKFYAIPMVTYAYRVGHKTIIWTKKRTNDMVKGFIDNLEISKQHGLAKLHQLTFIKFNHDYIDPIIKNINDRNLELLTLLIKANNLIDINLLKQEGLNIPNDFVIEPLKLILSPRTSYTKVRPIQDGFRYLKLYGLRYTCKQVLIKLSKGKANE